MGGVDELVISLAAKGLTTGEIAAHFQDVYGAEVSRDTISRITDAVLKEMGAWQTRPLDPVYPVVFVVHLIRNIFRYASKAEVGLEHPGEELEDRRAEDGRLPA